MKTSKSLQNKCLVALMYICLFPLCCMGQETSERIVDGVIETFTEYGTYDYTTKEAKDACDRLLSTSETMDYNVIFPKSNFDNLIDNINSGCPSIAIIDMDAGLHMVEIVGYYTDEWYISKSEF